ncbi:hypothetical protein BD769DRAFT_1400664, partial [Suillus cothurnatus]
VQEFEQYGILSIAINHDTPSDKTLWSCVSTGAYCNLLVAPEQFDPEGGPQTKQNQPFRQQKNSEYQAKCSPVPTSKSQGQGSRQSRLRYDKQVKDKNAIVKTKIRKSRIRSAIP